MDSRTWLLVSVLVVLLLLAAVALARRRKMPTDYYALFTFGVIWIIFSIPSKNYGLAAIGLICTMIGLANKDKWKTNTLSKKEWLLRVVLAVIIGLIFAAGVVVFVLNR